MPETEKSQFSVDEITKKVGGLNSPLQYLEGFPAYERLAGEIEARDVSRRMYKGKMGRRYKPPYSSENIPLEDWIVRRGDDDTLPKILERNGKK